MTRTLQLPPALVLVVLSLALVVACGDDDPAPRNDAGPTPADATAPAQDTTAPAPDTTAPTGDGPAGPYIKVKSPAQGAEWKTGSEQTIEWETSLEDVAISYSTDNGATWKKISDSVDVMSADWPTFKWTVPDEPTTEALIEVKGYDGEVPTRSAVFSIVK